ncbi:MAG: hypothetical protein ACR2LQ_05425 [Acidimicrobiales bacterium]
MNAAPDRPISRADLEAKMRELQGEVGIAKEQATSYAIAAGAVALVAIVGAAYLLGRRKGKKRSTVVEVRRL